MRILREDLRARRVSAETRSEDRLRKLTLETSSDRASRFGTLEAEESHPNFDAALSASYENMLGLAPHLVQAASPRFVRRLLFVEASAGW